MLTRCELRLCGVKVPSRRVRAFLHVSACTLFLADVLASLVLAAYLAHPIVGMAGAGSKVGAVLESISMFFEGETH